MSIEPTKKSILQTLVSELESYLPSLKANRDTIPIANDCYEAADDWCNLGRRVLENDTRVNFPERARGELMLLAQLHGILESKPLDEQKDYAPVLKAGGELVEIVGGVQPPADGHLGFLRISQRLFGFLQTEFDFSVVDEQPGSIRFSSGAVYLELDGLARDPWMSCCFGIESNKPHGFWIHDLLYLNHDERFRTLPERLEMNTATEIEDWFGFVAGILKQYGTPIFENRSGVLDALIAAQAERDAAYAREMEQKHGVQGN